MLGFACDDTVPNSNTIMKFAHGFKESLATQDFPPHWVQSAIPYSQLKKCLKKVQRELQDLGLDQETLRDLLDPNTTSPVALKYKLNAGSTSHVLRPKLTVYIHLQDGIAVDASLTPASKDFLHRIATSLSDERQKALDASSTDNERVVEELPDNEPGEESPSSESSSRSESPSRAESSSESEAQPAEAKNDTYQTIEVPLVFDSEFFDILQSDVNNLDVLQGQEEKNMSSEIVALGKEVAQVTKPTRFSKSDLARWRYIFELYLDAEVFFATHEQDHGARSSQVALKQLQWFQKEVEKRGLAKEFKLPESRDAFTRFINLNALLLKNLQFQELNKLAVTKILKKFDKRTALGISKAFPSAVQSDKLLAGSVAQDVCAEMSRELVSVVPQLNDYLCPVCFSVAYLPVRLECQHIFCIRCIVKIQRRREKHCPLCRADVVMRASADNLDTKLEKYMKKYFAKEVREKQRANEIERGIEDYGPGYTHQECTIM